MPTNIGKPKKYYRVRCTHLEKYQDAGIDARKVYCTKMKHRCLRFCAGQAKHYRSVVDFKYPAERRACYEQGLPLVWTSACTCDVRDDQKCKCSQSEASVMAFGQNALIRHWPIKHQTKGQKQSKNNSSIRSRGIWKQ